MYEFRTSTKSNSNKIYDEVHISCRTLHFYAVEGRRKIVPLVPFFHERRVRPDPRRVVKVSDKTDGRRYTGTSDPTVSENSYRNSDYSL